MVAKRRGSVRTGSKRVLEQIRENVEHLRDHPEHAVPACQGRCPLWCPFRRARKGVRRRHGMLGDDEKLERWGRWGNKYARAYATVLRLADADEDALEYVQNVSTHQGEVPIAPWGDAPALAHVGLQHHHDPSLRLLSTIPFLRSGDVVFATEEGSVCAHDGAPPDESLDLLFEGLPVDRPEGEVATCPHLSRLDPSGTYLEVDWPSADLTIRVCERCVSGNLLGRMQRAMVTDSIRELVDLDVHLERLEEDDGSPAPLFEFELPDTVLDAYTGGGMGDAELIEEARTARRFAVEGSPEGFVVFDGVIHRPPFEVLLDRLGPSQTERELLDTVLEALGRPVVLEEGTVVELLSDVWAEHGETALVDALGEEGHELFDPTAGPDDLERLLDEVADRRDAQRVEAALPAYESLPSPVDLADRVARAHLRQGRSRAQQILNTTPDEGERAVALALVRALELPRASWTVDPTTEEMADHLVPYAEALIGAEGEDYHEALVELLRATGSTADLERSD